MTICLTLVLLEDWSTQKRRDTVETFFSLFHQLQMKVQGSSRRTKRMQKQPSVGRCTDDGVSRWREFRPPLQKSCPNALLAMPPRRAPGRWACLQGEVFRHPSGGKCCRFGHVRTADRERCFHRRTASYPNRRRSPSFSL